MNTLSWLIYAAEVVARIGGLLVALAVVSAAIVAMVTVFTTIDDEHTQRSGPFLRRYAWIPVAFALVAALIPSSRTIYLVAASEVGEAVVTSPEAIEMMGDIKAIIQKRLKEQLGE